MERVHESQNGVAGAAERIPPIVPGPVPAPRERRSRFIPLGMMINGGCVALTCFAVPLAMRSNIWPIAGVFWRVMAVPVAVGLGALIGLLLRRVRPAVGIAALLATGAGLSVATAIIMLNNR